MPLVIKTIHKSPVVESFFFICSIIDECGASIYSISDAAQKEMPDLDPSLRGAGKICDEWGVYP